MKGLTRRNFLCAAAGGLGVLANSGSPAARAGQPGRNTTTVRAASASHQGEARHTRLQIIRLGDLALVGIPGEVFARLGLELRRRSPFRHTCIIGLANEQISYIPDRKAYSDGGYQTWVGWHSMLEVGTGEAMVDQAVAMLDELYDAAPPRRRGVS